MQQKVLGIIAFGLGFLANQPLTAVPESVPISTRAVSAAVLATWSAEYDKTTGLSRLEFLVLWRGEPGWIWSGPLTTRTMGTPVRVDRADLEDATAVRQDIAVGDVRLSATVNFKARTVRIGDVDVPLRDRNVILVDHADVPNGQRIVRVLSIDPELQGPNRVQDALRRVPELVSFLECNVVIGDPAKNSVARALCAQTLGAK